MYVIMYTGFYRMLPEYHFKDQIKLGYAFEVLLQVVPNFIILLSNRHNTTRGWLQNFQVTWKIIQILSLVIEIGMIRQKKRIKVQPVDESQERLVANGESEGTTIPPE